MKQLGETLTLEVNQAIHSALPQQQLHYRLNNWLQYIAQRQLQYETRNI